MTSKRDDGKFGQFVSPEERAKAAGNEPENGKDRPGFDLGGVSGESGGAPDTAGTGNPNAREGGNAGAPEAGGEDDGAAARGAGGNGPGQKPAGE